MQDLTIEVIFDWIMKFLTVIVVWVIPPIILFGLIIYSKSIQRKTTAEDNKISVKAGYWGGLILFVIYIVYQMPLFQPPHFGKIEIFQLNLWGLLGGVLVGFFLLLVLRKIVRTPIASFIVLLLTFCGTSGLFSYFFIRTFNDILISSTLGMAFGTFLHIMIMPKSIREIFGDTSKIDK